MSQRQAGAEAAVRYRSASKTGEAAILDEWCALAVWHRDHARKAPMPRAARDPQVASACLREDVMSSLRRTWAVMDTQTGMLLAPFLPEIIALGAGSSTSSRSSVNPCACPSQPPSPEATKTRTRATRHERTQARPGRPLLPDVVLAARIVGVRSVIVSHRDLSQPGSAGWRPDRSRSEVRPNSCR